MIHLAHIAPTEYLLRSSLFQSMNLYLILAHIVIQDKKYTHFFSSLKKGYKILDNSAFEFNQAVSDEILIKAIRLVNPHEFILPDVLGDGAGTKQRVSQFLHLFTDESIRLMAVIQGKSLKEWLDSYYLFSRNKRIYSIGIPVIYANRILFGKTIEKGYASGREYLFHYLHKHKILNPEKPHHLLGLNNICLEELQRLKRLSYIRSADSALAFLLAKYKNSKKIKKSNVKIDFQEKYNKVVDINMRKNILMLDRAAC